MATRTDFVTLNLPSLGTDEKPAKSHSCWRQWKQLSRFQRSLVYMFFLVSLIIYILIYSGNKPSMGHSSNNRGHSTVSSHRLEESESERHQRGLPLVEAPHQADIMKFNGGDGEEQNMAGEDKDDEEDDEDEDDEDEDDDFDGGDSNNANEEENEKKFGGPKNNHGTAALDGSIKFGGPQNERQRAVVAAFKHAWQVVEADNSTVKVKKSNTSILWIIRQKLYYICRAIGRMPGEKTT